MISVINPAAIAAGTPQTVEADLQKFDVAKEQVTLTEAELQKHYQIETVEQFNEAQEVLKVASKIEKAIEAKRKDLVGPFNGAVKKINDYAKTLSSGLNDGINLVKKGLLGYQQVQIENQMKALAAQREAQIIQMGFVFNDKSNTYELEGIGDFGMADLRACPQNVWDGCITNYANAIDARNAVIAQNLKDEVEALELFGGGEDVSALEQKLAEVSKPVLPVIQSTPAPEPAAVLKGLTKRWTFEVEKPYDVPRAYLVVDETAIRKAVADGARSIPGVRIFQTESITVR